MSEYTPEQYAQSAAKYGISPGEWTAHLCIENQKTKTGKWIFVSRQGTSEQKNIYFGGLGDMPRKSGDIREIERLPRTLIERDALKAGNERLRKALALIFTMNNGDPRETVSGLQQIARDALNADAEAAQAAISCLGIEPSKE